MTSTEEWSQIVPREVRVVNNPESWHNPTGDALRQLGSDLWVMERGYVDSKIDFGAKMTIVRLSDGRLFVHSCLPLDAEVKAKIDSLGQVSAVVAGNRQHIDFIRCWKKYYPDATFIAPPGILDSRPEWPFDVELNRDGTPHESYKDDAGSIQQIFLEGCPVMNETVFLHVPSKTLITCDAIFTYPSRNLPFGVHVARVGLTLLFKPILWIFYVKEKKTYMECHRKVANWDFENIIPCHGDIVQKDAVGLFKRWHGLS